GFRRRVDPVQAFPAHQVFRLLHFEAAVLQVGITAVRAPLLADLAQPLGRDGKTVKLVAVRLERAGQAHPVEVFRDQRVVRGADAELKRQVEAGRGLAAARDTDQYHVGLVEFLGRRAVVVGKREIDRLDALGVFLLVRGAVGTAYRV